MDFKRLTIVSKVNSYRWKMILKKRIVENELFQELLKYWEEILRMSLICLKLPLKKNKKTKKKMLTTYFLSILESLWCCLMKKIDLEKGYSSLLPAMLLNMLFFRSFWFHVCFWLWKILLGTLIPLGCSLSTLQTLFLFLFLGLKWLWRSLLLVLWECQSLILEMDGMF